MGEFAFAGTAPRSPNVNDNDFPFVIGEGVHFALRVRVGEVNGLFSFFGFVEFGRFLFQESQLVGSDQRFGLF